jgi:hypothetical protein
VEAPHVPRPTIWHLVPRPAVRHLVITKVLLSAAVALSVFLGVSVPVSADPGAFGVFSCSCGRGLTAVVGRPTVSGQINDGIQNGFADVQWVSAKY